MDYITSGSVDLPTLFGKKTINPIIATSPKTRTADFGMLVFMCLYFLMRKRDDGLYTKNLINNAFKWCSVFIFIDRFR